MLKKISVTAVLVMALLVTQFSASGYSLLNPNYEVLFKNNFDEGAGGPWRVINTIPAMYEFDISGGTFNIQIIEKGNKGAKDIQFTHPNIKIVENNTYTVKFSVRASNDCSIYAKIGDSKEPYKEDWSKKVDLKKGELVKFEETFKASRSAQNCEISFDLASDSVPLGTIFSFDDIYLTSKENIPPYMPPIISENKRASICVNSLGYYEKGVKKATFAANAKEPVDWVLEDNKGNEVMKGKSIVFGNDKDSSYPLHIIDFSSFAGKGKGYVLFAGGDESYKYSFPFDIGNDIYSQLKYDAMKYFYHNRSGTEISTPYCVDPKWAHPAEDEDYIATFFDESCMQSYSLNVSGGWYDSARYGKNVPVGGFAAWTLMNMYERALQNSKKGDTKAIEGLKDGTLNIPESKNKISDIIDEARWELEYLLKMQIPQGYEKAGMVHHKIYSIPWSTLVVVPEEYSNQRILEKPSTAATLHLAATGAQAYRIWKDYDKEFAEKCISAATTAWKAALENPNMNTPGYEASFGDTWEEYLKDEFYWAASELYISTGEKQYLDYITKSELYLKMPSSLTNGAEYYDIAVSCFSYSNTEGLGTISLALSDISLPSNDREIAISSIKKASDDFIKLQKTQGYGIPFSQSPFSDGNTGYPYGSNGYILNQCILFGYAYDFTNDVKYLHAATESMDYILGRNPNYQSYITGYGETPVQFPHYKSYWYERDLYPNCPPGFVVGGPNSGLEDTWAALCGWLPRAFPPQTCYMDNMESWSTNSVAVDFNASLSWVTAYLDDVNNRSISSMKGDINKDKEINSTDVSMLKRIILEIPISVDIDKKAGDINDDGEINSIDLAMLKRHVLNIKLIGQ